MSRALLLLIAFGALPATGCRSVNPLAKLEDSLVYAPMQYPNGDWYPQNLAVEDAWFTAEDGTKLHGWYVDHRNPRAVVLFAHGNAGNLTHRADRLRQLNERHQAAAMTFDYRGYGRSKGKPSEEGILLDARAARTWLANRTGVVQQDIVLMGRSLGGGVAVDLAAKDGARALVLESTFTSLPKAASKHVPWLPTGLVMYNRMNSLEKIATYGGPVLISHGDADRVIPFTHGRQLYQAAPGPKRFVTIPDGDHNDPQTEECEQALDELLASLPPVTRARQASVRRP